MRLSVRVNQVVDWVCLQVVLDEHLGVGQVLEKKQQFTWVNICVLEPLLDLFGPACVQQLPSRVQVEHLELLHVIRVRFRTSCKEYFPCLVNAALAE